MKNKNRLRILKKLISEKVSKQPIIDNLTTLVTSLLLFSTLKYIWLFWWQILSSPNIMKG